MYRILHPLKDAYVTDRVISGERVYGANTGACGTLDLFKLYGTTLSGSNPNIELSRLLIQFDLSPLTGLVAAGQVDPGNGSFACTLELFDVYGGQPTPANFTVVVNPLSGSFDEGLGRDVVFYGDSDTCNFLTASVTRGSWLASGCNGGGGLPGNVDYITASNGKLFGASQLFVTGEEDLSVDVTTMISATLAGVIPDEGFRIALAQQHETDTHSYFVKRFAARTAYAEDKRPRLVVRFDDSIQDDSQSLYLDTPATLFLYNYARSAPANILSGSSLQQVSGSNCLILKLSTEVSGGVHELVFTGSQHRAGVNLVTGIYSASVYLPSTDPVLSAKLTQSGSVDLLPIWGSLDGSVTYLTGSTITVHAPQRGSALLATQRFVVSVLGLRDSHPTDDVPVLRVNLFDYTSPLITVTRLPVELPGAVVRDVHYQVRDAVTGVTEILFDTVMNSTRVSSDAKGMWFMLDMSALTSDRSYVIDILVATGSDHQVHKAASPVFRVSDLH